MFKYYNMNQLVLPINLEVKLQENDIAYHIHHFLTNEKRLGQNPL